MVLFHENDCHFNLVVNKNDDLATLGSISRRLNVDPIVNTNENLEEVEVEITKNHEKPDKKVSDHKKCEDELKNIRKRTEI